MYMRVVLTPSPPPQHTPFYAQLYSLYSIDQSCSFKWKSKRLVILSVFITTLVRLGNHYIFEAKPFVSLYKAEKSLWTFSLSISLLSFPTILLDVLVGLFREQVPECGLERRQGIYQIGAASIWSHRIVHLSCFIARRWKVLLWIENKQSFQNKSPIFTPRRSASRQIKREFSLQCLFVLFFSHRRCLWNKNNSFFFLYLCRCTLPSVMLIRSEDGPIAGNSSIFKTAGIKRKKIYIYTFVVCTHQIHNCWLMIRMSFFMRKKNVWV